MIRSSGLITVISKYKRTVNMAFQTEIKMISTLCTKSSIDGAINDIPFPSAIPSRRVGVCSIITWSREPSPYLITYSPPTHLAPSGL
ncbi:hypothetical protein CEXT_285761 [Caerostris extrusa]|uniref:Uncharacterized protein n=1 Tax=Caerostris extrusa TaxID=172846 RepID=A0AAV4V0Q6_CAEEX|nr:hypothetical protein CEXT_285761 [Caerostris extrusa]